MKRIKCYGQRKSRLIETSATRRFFGDLSKNSSNSSQDKSFQADVYEVDNSKRSSERKLSKSRVICDNPSSGNSNTLANWRSEYIKFKYSNCNNFKYGDGKSATKKKYCETGKQKQKILKNITSTPASNRRVSLKLYFNEKYNNEAAVRVESTNVKFNRKKIGDSSPKNSSVRSYTLSTNDTGFCLMDDGSIHHLMKPSINITPLTKRTLRYNLALSSKKRNKADRKEETGKKLKLHNSTEHSVNIEEDPSNKLDIVLNEDVHKYATVNSISCNVHDKEDNSLVLNEDIHKHVTLNSITCNVSEEEDDSLKEMMKSKLQSFDSGHIQDEYVISTGMNMKETKTCNLSDRDNSSIKEAKTCNLSDEDNNSIKGAKTCNLSDHDNNSIKEAKTCNLSDQDIYNNEAAVRVESTNVKFNRKKTGDSSPKNSSVRSYTLSTNDTGFCLMDDGSIHHLMKPSINITPLTKRTLRYNLALSSKKRNKADRKEETGKKLKLHNSTEHSVNIEEDPSNKLDIVLNEDVHKYATVNSISCNVHDKEDNSLVLNEDIHKHVTLNSITCNVSEEEDDSLKEMMKSKLQSFDSGHIQDEYVISTGMNMKETKTCNLSDRDNSSIKEAKTCNLSDEDNNSIKGAKTCNLSDHDNNSIKEAKTCNLSDQDNNSIKEAKTCNSSDQNSKSIEEAKTCNLSDQDNNSIKEAKTCNLSDQDNNSIKEPKTCNLSDQGNNSIKETKEDSKLQSSDEHFINIENDCALSLLNLKEIKKEVDADLVVATESEEVPAILIKVIDGVFRSSTIKLQKKFLKNQERVLQDADLAAPFQNEKVPNFRTIIKALLNLSSNKQIINFNEAYDWSCYTAKRMGESSCAELFKLSTKQTNIILKIIVVEYDHVSLMNLLAEVKIFKCLNKLRNESRNYCMNFCELKRVLMVRGEFPSLLREAWEADPSDSYAFDPHHYKASQMYVIFEMDYGGISLSKYMPKTQKEALSIVLQLGLALAVAEEALLFEHRDLHLDNVLVKKTDKSVAYFRLKGVPIVVDNLGWEVIIIDFSLSKMVLNNTTYFHDLRFSDELFQQQGHAQYELYRVMKKALKNKWDQTLLLTNMQWVTLIGKELFRELEKLGLGKKSPALQKYLYVTERSLSAQEFISLCVDSTNELYDKLFKPKPSLEPPECIWID